MTWIRLDDAMLDNAKIAAVGPLGFALHVAAIIYCARNLTDGFIPYGHARRLLAMSWTEDQTAHPDKGPLIWTAGIGSGMHGVEGQMAIDHVIEILQDAELWQSAPHGYIVHDYLEYNPSKATVLAARAEREESGRKGGQASALARAQAAAQANNQAKPQAKSNPVPVPVPSVSSNELTSSDASDLCQKLEASLHAWGAKGHTTEAWTTAADRLLRLDKRPLDEVIRVLEWATKSEFWRPNIMSMATFREKYDTLRGQMMRDIDKPVGPDRGSDYPIKPWVDPYTEEEAERDRQLAQRNRRNGGEMTKLGDVLGRVEK